MHTIKSTRTVKQNRERERERQSDRERQGESKDKWEGKLQATIKEVCLESRLERVNTVRLPDAPGQGIPTNQMWQSTDQPDASSYRLT